MNDLEPRVWFSQALESKSAIWLVLLAIWGGTANYMRRISREKEKFRIAELLGEWCVSGFAGLLTAYICMELQLSWQLTCFMAGIAGHMGGRAIYVFEQRFKKLWEK